MITFCIIRENPIFFVAVIMGLIALNMNLGASEEKRICAGLPIETLLSIYLVRINRWFYHYTGAIIADKFLRDGKGKILWDGVTGRYIDNFKDLIFEIQRFQQLPRVNQASFHVEHAILWHFVASVMPDVTEYPSDIANSFCHWDGRVRVKRIKGRGVGKGITHECYHGFGHAVFYVVAKRQARREGHTVVADSNTLYHPGASFRMTNFRSVAASVSQVRSNAGPQSGSTENTTSPVSTQNAPATYIPPLISRINGTISVSTEAAIEIAKATMETSSARIQFRPNIGFELTPDSMCEVFHLCKGAARQSDAFYEDEEPRYPFSHGVRICLEGVVHSVRLFSKDRHDKQDAINYVNENMQRCHAQELILDTHENNSQVGVSIVEEKNNIAQGLDTESNSETNPSNMMPEMLEDTPNSSHNGMH
jgi:hypothetical protein